MQEGSPDEQEVALCICFLGGQAAWANKDAKLDDAHNSVKQNNFNNVELCQTTSKFTTQL